MKWAWRGVLPPSFSKARSRKGAGADGAPMENPDSTSRSSTTDGLPVAPSMGPALLAVRAPHQTTAVGPRTVYICGLAVGVAVAASAVAQLLTRLIGFITNLSFYG